MLHLLYYNATFFFSGTAHHGGERHGPGPAHTAVPALAGFVFTALSDALLTAAAALTAERGKPTPVCHVHSSPVAPPTCFGHEEQT